MAEGLKRANESFKRFKEEHRGLVELFEHESFAYMMFLAGYNSALEWMDAIEEHQAND